ncbi:hypothetical protein [Halobaculum sp. P14]|uniref:hypothetical protein n=1 Tax=Halobaculum sp. P14 TaxID=3421638 RepID=UPI003EC10880
MSQRSVKEQITDRLRSSSEPAQSAQQLADDLDVSIPTINSYIEELVSEKRVATTQIGNATAYYIPEDESRTSTKHACKKCGRITDGYDSVKLEESKYFENPGDEGSTTDFYILCRFCYNDFVSWVWNDSGMMGEYPGVHSWNIADNQMEEVREDPDIKTSPSTEHLEGQHAELLELIKSLYEDDEETAGVPKEEIIEDAVDTGMSERVAKVRLNELHQTGYVWQRLNLSGLTYTPAK